MMMMMMMVMVMMMCVRWRYLAFVGSVLGQARVCKERGGGGGGGGHDMGRAGSAVFTVRVPAVYQIRDAAAGLAGFIQEEPRVAEEPEIQRGEQRVWVDVAHKVVGVLRACFVLPAADPSAPPIGLALGLALGLACALPHGAAAALPSAKAWRGRLRQGASAVEACVRACVRGLASGAPARCFPRGVCCSRCCAVCTEANPQRPHRYCRWLPTRARAEGQGMGRPANDHDTACRPTPAQLPT